MDRIRIRGGTPLSGTIAISGAKNAALPLMAASLLSTEPLKLSNIPHLMDIATMASLLGQMGVTISLNGEEPDNYSSQGRVVTLHAEKISNTTAAYELVRKMRASILVLGPLLARCGEAVVSLPGGCAIGTRPVDLHLKGLEKLGAEIDIKDGYVHAKAPNGLSGTEFTFPFISVGASENLMMAASLAKGTTILKNVAREPEIADLANCLVTMGAQIEGIGSDTLTITGVEKLGTASHTVIPDRIETATYAIAAAITRGELELTQACPDHITTVLQTLEEMGAQIEKTEDSLRIDARNNKLIATDVTTKPYPGYPTDAQAQIMALMATVEGAATIQESIFENRFMHVPELKRMGADITLNKSIAMVRGVESLTGAPVMATDLRASVCLVLAGLAAQGETLVHRVYHLDRGYERVEDKLAACGADITREREE